MADLLLGVQKLIREIGNLGPTSPKRLSIKPKKYEEMEIITP